MFSLHFRLRSVKLSLFSPTIVQQSHDKGAREAEKGAEKGASDIWSDRALAFPIRPAEMGKQLEQLLQL